MKLSKVLTLFALVSLVPPCFADTLPSPPSATAEPAPGRSPRDAREFDQMFEQIKNWNRWGADDQLGAVHLITEEKRRQALRLAKTGLVVSLSHAFLTEAAVDNPDPFEHTMLAPFDQATDVFKMNYHGFAFSHLDALCHYSHKGQTYNGYLASEVYTAKGCTKLGVQNLKNGLVTRGVLIDIARLRNVPFLEPGTAVYAQDIEAWERKSGTKVAAGDAIFLRTGRWARREKLGPWPWDSQGLAGFHASVAQWFKSRGISIVGTDAVLDVEPSHVEGVQVAPLHELAIAGLGIVVLDNQDLEALSQEAARMNRWEFLLTVTPLVVTNGTGSPVNALAIF